MSGAWREGGGWCAWVGGGGVVRTGHLSRSNTLMSRSGKQDLGYALGLVLGVCAGICLWTVPYKSLRSLCIPVSHRANCNLSPMHSKGSTGRPVVQTVMQRSRCAMQEMVPTFSLEVTRNFFVFHSSAEVKD